MTAVSEQDGQVSFLDSTVGEGWESSLGLVAPWAEEAKTVLL